MFLKSEATEAAEHAEKMATDAALKSFYDQFGELAKKQIKPDLQQAAEMFLQANYPAAVYSAEHEIALQVAPKGYALDSVNKKDAPGVSLKFHANFQDFGLIFVTTGGINEKTIFEKLEIPQITAAKVSELLKKFVPLALARLR